MARPLAFVLCVALLLQPGSARAEPSEAPAPGTRVRLTAPELFDQPLIGTLTALETDAVSLRLEGWTEPTTVPRTAITKWELSRGKHSNAGKGALKGLAIGAVAGLGLAALLYNDDQGDASVFYSSVGAFWGGHRRRDWGSWRTPQDGALGGNRTEVAPPRRHSRPRRRRTLRPVVLRRPPVTGPLIGEALSYFFSA